MIRALHLLSFDPDLQSLEGSRTLRDAAAPWAEITTWTIGRGGRYANLLWAVIGLRREVVDYDLVHAWDEQSLAAAVIAGARRIVFTAPALLRPRSVGRLKGVMRFRDVRVVCTTPTQRRMLVALGVSPDRCVTIRPAIDHGPAEPSTRSDVRRRLGLADEDVVLLTPGESTRPAAHERAVWAGSILHVTDERYRVLLWGRGPRLDIAVGLGRKLRQPRLVVSGERTRGRAASFAELLPAADALLVTAAQPAPTLAVAIAMTAGVPVVAVERPELAELLVDGTTALTVPNAAPRGLARRVLDLREDPQLGQSLRSRGASRARELFAGQNFHQTYRALYGLVASQEQPAMSVITPAAALAAATPPAMPVPAPPSP